MTDKQTEKKIELNRKKMKRKLKLKEKQIFNYKKCFENGTFLLKVNRIIVITTDRKENHNCKRR